MTERVLLVGEDLIVSGKEFLGLLGLEAGGTRTQQNRERERLEEGLC